MSNKHFSEFLKHKDLLSTKVWEWKFETKIINWFYVIKESYYKHKHIFASESITKSHNQKQIACKLFRKLNPKSHNQKQITCKFFRKSELIFYYDHWYDSKDQLNLNIELGIAQKLQTVA